ncbi:MAG TPA: glutathione S-transferase family protein [Caulobacterales bacterium]|nr:glutathione S-transferase family protein [Caulobacterales bacterium]
MSGVLTIYGSAVSGNCLKGKWVADLLGVPNRWVEVDIFKGESRTPEFLAMNPAGQVPVAVLPDARILAQSNAIMLYLAEGSRLVPADAYQRGKMYEWLFWEQYNHEPSIAVRRALLQFRGKTEAELDPALLAKGNACLERMQLQLNETPYLVGHALTLADIALVAYTRVAHEGGYDLNQFPLVKAWVARVERDLGLAAAQAVA